MKKIGITVLTMIMLVLALSAAVFAYWSSGFNQDDKNMVKSVQIGSGDVVETTISIQDVSISDILVPSGRAVKANEVEHIAFDLKIEWISQDDKSNFSGILDVVSKDHNKLLVFEFTGLGKIVTGETKTIGVKITLTEPNGKEEYESVAGKNLDFTLVLSVK